MALVAPLSLLGAAAAAPGAAETAWRSLRGRHAQWKKEDVDAIAHGWIQQLPRECQVLLEEKTFTGGNT
eukprot:8904538-Pyramimonas_sp.AAC.1